MQIPISFPSLGTFKEEENEEEKTVMGIHQTGK
jgi:hypothetical protein